MQVVPGLLELLLAIDHLAVVVVEARLGAVGQIAAAQAGKVVLDHRAAQGVQVVPGAVKLLLAVDHLAVGAVVDGLGAVVEVGAGQIGEARGHGARLGIKVIPGAVDELFARNELAVLVVVVALAVLGLPAGGVGRRGLGDGGLGSRVLLGSRSRVLGSLRLCRVVFNRGQGNVLGDGVGNGLALNRWDIGLAVGRTCKLVLLHRLRHRLVVSHRPIGGIGGLVGLVGVLGPIALDGTVGPQIGIGLARHPVVTVLAMGFVGHARRVGRLRGVTGHLVRARALLPAVGGLVDHVPIATRRPLGHRGRTLTLGSSRLLVGTPHNGLLALSCRRGVATVLTGLDLLASHDKAIEDRGLFGSLDLDDWVRVGNRQARHVLAGKRRHNQTRGERRRARHGRQRRPHPSVLSHCALPPQPSCPSEKGATKRTAIVRQRMPTRNR